MGARNLQPHPCLPLNKASLALTVGEELIIDLHAIEVPTETTGVVLEPAVQLHLSEEIRRGEQTSEPSTSSRAPKSGQLFKEGRSGRKQGSSTRKVAFGVEYQNAVSKGQLKTAHCTYNTESLSGQASRISGTNHCLQQPFLPRRILFQP